MKKERPKNGVTLDELRGCFRSSEKPIRKCVKCGAEITGRNRKYCAACQQSAYEEVIQARRQEVTVTCKRCGVEFKTINSGKGYVRTLCDDCRYEPLKEKNRFKAKEKPRVSHIDDIQQAARKAGMSYGRYVAMMAMKKGEEKK